jgi:calcineurin-like phosphoesterase family protein
MTKNNFKIYCLADSHFGHSKMMELCGRPEGFESKILKHLTEIPPGAILIHLGDFCIGNDKMWHQAFMAATKQCKRRILILGNHDHRSMSFYLDCGWDFVAHSITLEVFGKRILFTHRPAPDGDYDINVHGHLHNTNHHNASLHGKNKLLAIENTNYMPVNLEKFINRQ